MTEELKISVNKFDGKNFTVWKKQISVSLLSKSLFSRLTEEPITEPEKLQDYQVQAILINSLSADVGQKVVNCKTSKEVWTRLLAIYENTSQSNVDRVLEEFYTYRMTEGGDIASHISKVEAMGNLLESLKQPQTENALMTKMLMSLPSSYLGFRRAWDSVHPSLKKKDELISRLMREENDIKGSGATAETALIAKSRPNIAELKKRTKCNRCGRVGHWARECYDKRGSNNNDEVALIASPHNANPTHWVMDSGASKHTCNNRDSFTEYTLSEDTIQVGNRECIKAIGRGTVIMNANVYGKRIRLVLNNVLHAPDISRNLFSIGSATQRGAIADFNGRKCEIKMDGIVKAVAVYNETSRLYLLDAKVEPPAVSTLICLNERNIGEWHKALGHTDVNIIKQMHENGAALGLKIAETKPQQCEVCPSGKATRATHGQTSEELIEQVGAVIDMDLIGPIATPALKGEKYCILMQDRFSKMAHGYFVVTKDETVEKIQDYIAAFEVESGQQVKRIHTDNGSEFCNAQVRSLLAIEHIMLSNSAPYCPQQNGYAERHNRTILETARTLLSGSGLPLYLWPQAMESSIYVRNRVIKNGQKSTPFETFTGRKPTVSHIVPFGTPCQALTTDRRSTKFDSKTENAFICGFTSRRNTYKIYIPETKIVRITCDIVWREHFKRGQDPQSGQFELSIGDKVAETRHEQRRNMDPGLLDEFFRAYIQPPTAPSEPIYENSHMQRSSTPFRENTSFDTTGPPTLVEQNCTITDNSALISEHIDVEPQSYSEAVISKDKNLWEAAIKDELNALEKNNTWEIIDSKPDTNMISTKWVFKIKRNQDSTINKYKARLVARGFSQRENIDFFETYAPVAKIETIRLLLVLSVREDMKYKQFDVASAFLHGKIDEDVYINPPEGLDISKDKCLKLKKALYGLRQSPRAWNAKLNESLCKLGFRPTLSDPCVYISSHYPMWIVIYVDDGIVFAKDIKQCTALIEKLNQFFETKEVKGGFLGMEIIQTNKGLFISQKKYVIDIATKFEVDDCKPISTPLADCASLYLESPPASDNKFRSIVSSILYAGITTRPDLLFTTILLSRFNQKPNKVHLMAALRALKYLYCTRNTGILIEKNNEQTTIDVYSDSDWAGDQRERKSTSGVLIKVSGTPIVFVSRKQGNPAASSTEAEIIAACEAVKELRWVTNIMSELSIRHKKPTLHIDNQSAISLIKNNEINRRSKHFELKYHIARHAHENNQFDLKHIPGTKQPADFLTKSLSGPKLKDQMQVNSIVSLASCLNLCLMLFCLIGKMVCHPDDLFTGHPLIFTETDHYVDDGVWEFKIQYTYSSPCSSIREMMKNANSTFDLKRKSLARLAELCDQEYVEQWIPAIDDLGKCNNEGISLIENVKRTRRWIIWFLVAAFVVAVVVTTLIVVSLVMDHKIETVNNEVEKVKAEAQELQKKLNVTKFMFDNTEKSLEFLLDANKDNRQALEELSMFMPDLQVMGTRAILAIREARDDAVKITQACKKQKIDIDSLFRLTRVKNLKLFETRDTYLDDVQRINSDTIVFSFAGRKRSRTTTISKIFGISHWVESDVGSPNIYTDWKGPAYVIQNKTANCTRGIDVPIQAEVHEKCDTKDFVEPELLDGWRPAERQPLAKETPVIVVATPKHNFVYCFFHNFTMFQKNMPCPPWVTKIPRDVPFMTEKQKYSVTIKNIEVKSLLPHAIPINAVDSIANYRAYEKQMENLHKMKEAGEVLLKNSKEQAITSPLGWTLPSFPDLISKHYGLIIEIIGIVVCVYSIIVTRSGCGTNGAATGAMNENENETINININNDNQEPGQSMPMQPLMRELPSFRQATPTQPTIIQGTQPLITPTDQKKLQELYAFAKQNLASSSNAYVSIPAPPPLPAKTCVGERYYQFPRV